MEPAFDLHLRALSAELGRIHEAIAAVEASLGNSSRPESSELVTRLERSAKHIETALEILERGDARPAPREPRRNADLQGSSRAIPIQDLLSFLATAKKSGLLRVHTPGERFLLQLEHGDLVYAYGDAPPEGEGLREVLLAQGRLTPEALARLPGCEAQNAWLDPALLETGWLSREDLASALSQQMRLSFFRLCSGVSTRFVFYEGASVQNVVRVRQNAVELLLEFTHFLDEAAHSDSAEDGVPAEWEAPCAVEGLPV